VQEKGEGIMATELPKQYDPHEAQQRWLAFWDERGFFHSVPDPDRTPYTIVIPPPNVTGALHMGHALNNTLQDVLIRWRRAQGYNALYLPGTDHAGIATQAVVEKRLREEEGKTRHDLGREELVRRIWQWKDQYEKRILGQLRQLGCSCDWQRTRFTLDPICARAVRETFFHMFRDGLIFRGKRLVNWDAHLQTAVADDEVENVKQKGTFYYFRYPVIEGPAGSFDHVLIGTTRPETMLGDTAVAVHPEPARELDKRQRELEERIGKANDKEARELRAELDRLVQRREEMVPILEKLAAMAAAGTVLALPLVGRRIPLIADTYADPTKGTGAVKITPAHDYNDHAVGERHPEIGAPINILHPDGRINDNGKGEYRGRTFSYAGLDRADARTEVVADLTELGLFDRQEEVENSIPISDRSKTPIEPYLSDQWFVRMKDLPDGRPGLAQLAMDAVTSKRVRITPERYDSTYLDWLGEKRDWCVSRQLWWGHRIPIWYTQAPESALTKAFAGRSDVTWRRDESGEGWLICALTDLPVDALGAEYSVTQDPDVLDTWFSSALWPHSTLGWPERTPELAYYYPTSTLVTNRDIITLWVARMVLTGLFNLNEVPFRDVYIHPTILDGFGVRMSKSKGNGIDPLDIIDRYGTDALRFMMVFMATESQDNRMPVANVCPHCDHLVAQKQEHQGMRTRRLNCPECKKPFRPNSPWPEPAPALPTAKVASDRFDMGRHFANKLWNAARFLLLNMEGYTPGSIEVNALPLEDRWILSRLATTAAMVTEQLEGFRFSDAARTIYDFTWSEFCDWYIEMSKGRLRDEGTRPAAQRVLAAVLDAILRLVQPIMPFLAESVWQAMGEAAPTRGLPTPLPAAESVCIAPWPTFPEAWRDPAMETRLARMQDLVSGVREVRNRYMIDSKTSLDVVVRCSADAAADFRSLAPFIGQLAGVGKLDAGPETTRPKQSATKVSEEIEFYVSLAGHIDVAAEKTRLEKQMADKTRHLQATRAKLANPSFVERAKPEVVQQERDRVADLENQLKVIEESLRDLGQG
jgi:valyl-tRNA synthetase